MKWLLCVLIMVALASCQEEERLLNAVERQQVSQRYADSVRILTPVMDSACDANRPTLVALLADSLYQQRLEDLLSQRKNPGQ